LTKHPDAWGVLPLAAAALDVTYLDDELRISRGQKGNLFVLRMVDRDEKP
jgi:hypothetical protein